MLRVEDRKQRWIDFMSLEHPSKNVILINYVENIDPMPKLWPELKKERIEWIWQLYNMYMDNIQWLNDDRVPYLDMHTGTEIFAEAMGCKVHRSEDSNPFALPFVHNASDAEKVKVPELSSSSLTLLFEMADELQRRAGKKAVFRLPDIQSPMDITALIWNKEDLFVAMIEEPEAVKELSEKVYTLLTAFMDEWFKRYGREFVAHYPCYYMKQGITLSEDEIGSVSPAKFDEFFLPHLIRLSERYGGIGIHCCANAGHQWNNFKKIPALRLLNLVQPKPVLKKAYEFFAGHVAQMHSWSGDGPAWTWPAQHTYGEKFALQVTAASRQAANELADKLCEACSSYTPRPFI